MNPQVLERGIELDGKLGSVPQNLASRTRRGRDGSPKKKMIHGDGDRPRPDRFLPRTAAKCDSIPFSPPALESERSIRAEPRKMGQTMRQCPCRPTSSAVAHRAGRRARTTRLISHFSGPLPIHPHSSYSSQPLSQPRPTRDKAIK